MPTNSDIQFVRIRGRIVPIRKKRKDELKKAVGFTSAGLATSYFAGSLSGKSALKSKFRHQMNFDFINETGGFTPKTIRKKGVDSLRRRSKYFRFGGQALGGILIAQGIQRFLVDDNSTSKEVISEVGGHVSAAIVASQFKKQFGIRTKISVPSPVKRVAKDLASRFIKRQLRFKL